MKTRNIFLLALSAIFAAACHTWDEPSAEAGMESYGNQYIQETNVVTIDALKTQYKNAINNDGLEKISKPTQIKVIVTGNDEGSNLYKQLYVTDGTGSLYMSIDKSGIFSEAAVGQCMLIELEGLYIGGYGKQPEIGTFYHNDKKNKDQVGRMSRYTWQEHFKLISPVEGLSTKPVMLSTLQGLNIEKDCGKLVTLVGVKMEGADGKITFAPSNEADAGGGVSRKIEGMSNVVVRSSTYAKHAAMIMPTEKINVTGIASRYNSTWQIMPRTQDDITLTTGNEDVDPYVEETIGTKEEPITVAKAIELINSYEDGGTSPSAAIVKGKISKIDSYNSNYKSITYYISDDGSTNNQIQVYSGKGLNGADFAAQSDLKVGQVVIVKGTLKKYVNKAGKVTPEIDQSSEILSITDGEGGDTPATGSGEGTEASPYDVTAAIAKGAATNTWIKGYIVGYVPGQKIAESVFGTTGEVSVSNILIAANPDETDYNKCMPIQLPGNTDIRTKLNLKDNAGNLKKEVILYGNIEKYFGVVGLKSPSYAILDGTGIGTKPGGGSGETANHGTADAPLTVAQAISLIDAESTIDEAYVKGKISKIDSYNATYKSITYWISDDGGTTTQLQVYSGKGLNGADFSSKEDLTVGQTVVIKGKLKKYNTTYEFDKTSSIISIQ